MRGFSCKSNTHPKADICLDGRHAKFLLGFSACCSPSSWYRQVGGHTTVNFPFFFSAPDSTISEGHVWSGQREIHNSAVVGRRHFAAVAAAQWDPLGISGHRDFPRDERNAAWWKRATERAHLMSGEENSFVQGPFSSQRWIKLPAMLSSGSKTISTHSNLLLFVAGSVCWDGSRTTCQLMVWISSLFHLPVLFIIIIFSVSYKPRTAWAQIFAQFSWIGQHMYLFCLCVFWEVIPDVYDCVWEWEHRW